MRGGVGSDELSGESGDGCEISRLDGMDESGDGGGAKGAMGVCHKLGVGEAADREVCVIGGGEFPRTSAPPASGVTLLVLDGGGKCKDQRFSSGRFEPVKKGVGESGLKNSAVVLV